MNTSKLRPCMEKLLESKELLRDCKGEELEGYRHVLTADCRRAGRDRWETAAVVRQLYRTARPNAFGEYFFEKADKYVDWAFEQEFLPLTCSQIRRKARVLCGKGDCPFAQRLRAEATQRREEQSKDDRFEELGWPNTLEKRHRSTGRIAAVCFLALRDKMVAQGGTYDEIIFVSMPQFQKACSKAGEPARLKAVGKAVDLLTTEEGYGLIRRIVRTKKGGPGKGEYGHAPGYQIILPTRQPPQDIDMIPPDLLKKRIEESLAGQNYR
jgi:hypothetical protein